MTKITTLITFLIVVSIGFAMAFQPIDMPTSRMTFTGGVGFTPVDMTTSTMKFTGQQ